LVWVVGASKGALDYPDPWNCACGFWISAGDNVHPDLSSRCLRDVLGQCFGSEYDPEESNGCNDAVSWQEYVCQDGARMGKFLAGFHYTCYVAAAMDVLSVW
jgi:hypothetical protein